MQTFSPSKPLFWILFGLLGCISIPISFKYFSRAFPIANIDLKANRSDVLTKAHELAESNHWGPQDYQDVASFEQDAYVQLYVELEAGGNQAFADMVQGTLYSPYFWNVRLFKEGETNETSVYFKPDGTPYGFCERIAELAPGAHLQTVEARTIAEEQATKQWNINLTEYSIVESSQEVRLNGRIDHTFVYERPTVQVGEGRYRLKLMVTGDKLSCLEHFIKVPEGFNLRYEQMRSFNNNISTFAFILIFLYAIIGCVLGLYILNKQRWVIWSTPFLASLLLCLLSLLKFINEFPLIWTHYDTALPKSSFLLRYCIQIVFLIAQNILIWGLTFTAAESLTRKAFGNHPQLWKTWLPQAGHSYQILGRTIGGYLLALINVGWIIGTYIIMRSFFGWWLPSDALVDPNILATYAPWISPFCRALQAGFWEECLFRAIPISCAVLIGQWLGKRNLFLILGIIIQALIFGAAHADYPQQPSYARIVEVFIPCIIWGITYVVFGLLPVIITHVLYDFILMSLPLFVSHASGSLINQGMIISCALIPLFILIYYRIQQGKWSPLPTSLYNRSWHPETHHTTANRSHSTKHTAPFTMRFLFLSILAAGIALAGWLGTQPWHHDEQPTLQENALSRLEACTLADEVLKRKNIELSTDWKQLTHVVAGPQDEDRFIWRTSGQQAYTSCMTNNYIKPPHWHIRYAHFNGALEDRAEEYHVFIGSANQQNQLLRLYHKLPENRPGAQLTEQDARTIALEAFKKHFGIAMDVKNEISATPNKLPSRIDWTFTYAYPTSDLIKEGQLRTSITISGDQITDLNTYVHIPEDWIRTDRNEQSLIQLVIGSGTMTRSLLWLLVALFILMFGMFDGRILKRSFAFFVSLSIIQIILTWPSLMFMLKTSQPIAGQLFGFLASAPYIASTIGLNGCIALFLAYISLHTTRIKHVHSFNAIAAAIGLGIFYKCAILFISSFGHTLIPTWAYYDSADTYFPIISTGLILYINYLSASIFLMGLILIFNYLSNAWSWYAAPLFFILLGIIMSQVTASIGLWLITALAMGLIVYYAYRYVLGSEPQLVLWFYAASITINIVLQLLYHAYVGALLGNIFGLGLVWVSCYYLYTYLTIKQH